MAKSGDRNSKFSASSKVGLGIAGESMLLHLMAKSPVTLAGGK